MNILTASILILNIFFFSMSFAAQEDFETWLNKFKIRAINSGISKKVVDDVMSDARFLPKVIEYDRFQPEFYEDTFTSVSYTHLTLPTTTIV